MSVDREGARPGLPAELIAGASNPELLTKEEWHQAAEAAVEEATRTGTPLSVLFIDVNWFKEVNDTLGHVEGDEVIDELKSIVAEIVDSFRWHTKKEPRPLDIVAIAEDETIEATGGHLGGDEIGVLAHTDETGAHHMAERIREVGKAHLARPEKPALAQLEVSLAIGAATLQPGMSKKDLLRAADKAMYDDKENQLPELTELQERLLQLGALAFESAGIKLRDVPKHWRRMSR